MKRLIFPMAILTAILILILAFGESGMSADASSYLRIHIRADSNEEEAQAIKYQVRDEIVRFLTPVVAECETKEEAIGEIGARLREIEAVATNTLRAGGFPYGAKASLKREEFPTRIYDSVTLQAGVYDALILELGSGKGDNWWCVVYPPLCFSGGNTEIVYKSKIKEIIENFFGRSGKG